MEELAPEFDVFFSYARDDAPRAERIADALRERRLRVWIDSAEIRPMERWAEEIEEGLRCSRVYAMLVTRRALKSRWVMEEYYAALAIGNSGDRPRIVPVVAEDVRLPVFLSIRQWVDLRRPDRFDVALRELLECIRAEPPCAAEGGEPTEGAEKAEPEREEESTGVVSAAEIAWLRRALARERRALRDMRMVRVAAVLLGIIIAIGLLTGGAPGGVALAAGVTLFVALVGWAATERRIAGASARENRLQLMQEKLEECRTHRSASCDGLQPEFWKLVHGHVGAGAERRMDDAA